MPPIDIHPNRAWSQPNCVPSTEPTQQTSSFSSRPPGEDSGKTVWLSNRKPAFCSQTDLHSKSGCYMLAVTADNYLTSLGLSHHLENRLMIPTSQSGCEGQAGSVHKTRQSSVTGTAA